MSTLLPVFVAVSLLTAGPRGMQNIGVSEDGRRFVFADSGEPFVPWGFNYDHDRSGRLIEDYWQTEWNNVEADFAEMKELGANVVRVHLQFGKFMQDPRTPNKESLIHLARLVRLAEKLGLYLDLTGLGCYHKKDVPRWYDQLERQERWNAQARFWEAVAGCCAGSPAVFCYDLMNEPVVPGDGDKRGDWLGPPFGESHFVQFISLDNQGRPRHDVARQWIARLVDAVRNHDRHHLVTVGLVPWSLDRPGLTSGFIPERVVERLDFVAVHLYPESGKPGEALATLRGFSVGKPVLVEEMFPLDCTAAELGAFIDQSKAIASGWIGFYWGKTPSECRASKTIGDAIMLNWLELFAAKRKSLGL
jgi:hypothetical protein